MVRTHAIFLGFFFQWTKEWHLNKYFYAVVRFCLPQSSTHLYSCSQGTEYLSQLSNTASWGTTSKFPISPSNSTFSVFCFLHVSQQWIRDDFKLQLIVAKESKDEFFHYSQADSTRQSVTVQVVCSSLKITNY